MNLKQEQLEELNTLLKLEKLDIPSFRKEVLSTGTNYSWLQKHILKKNPNISNRLKELLYIK